MKQPFWKWALSYFTEIELEAASSQLNPELILSLKKGRYCLATPNAIYSFGDLYDNFRRTFKQMNLDDRHIQEVLVLGFGLGSVPYMLEKVFHKKYRYTGVEADDVIALWASRYVLDELESPVEMHMTDAFRFVQFCEESFDLVIMDIFVDDEIPVMFRTEKYLHMLGDLLSADGLLLYNCLAFKENDKLKTRRFFESTFKKVFPQASYLDVGGNWILSNRPF